MSGRARGRARSRARGAAASVPRPGGDARPPEGAGAGTPQQAPPGEQTQSRSTAPTVTPPQGSWQGRQHQAPPTWPVAKSYGGTHGAFDDLPQRARQDRRPLAPSMGASAQGGACAYPGNIREQSMPWSSGRGIRRGDTRPERRPGGDSVYQATRQMERMNIHDDRQPADEAMSQESGLPVARYDPNADRGERVNLMSNHFRVEACSDGFMHIYQYDVAYKPEIESRRMRLGMMHEQHKTVGLHYAFDGAMLFLPHKLDKKTELYCKRISDDAKIQMTIELKKELEERDPTRIQFLNLSKKNYMKHNNMVEISRNFYNPQLAIQIPQHRLEVWPGFATSILEYAGGPMLNVDVSHKVLRTDTAYDYLVDLFNQFREDKSETQKMIIGEIVMTR